MSWLDEPIRIIQIRLPKEASKTWRVLHDANPDLYPVHVGLSRPVNEYERKELAEFHIDADEENRYFAVISETTLEFVRDGIGKFHDAFDSAVEKARQAQEDAQNEDQRLMGLTKDLTRKLRRDAGLDPPLADERAGE